MTLSDLQEARDVIFDEPHLPRLHNPLMVPPLPLSQ
jgi:hypothetical protein